MRPQLGLLLLFCFLLAANLLSSTYYSLNMEHHRRLHEDCLVIRLQDKEMCSTLLQQSAAVAREMNRLAYGLGVSAIVTGLQLVVLLCYEQYYGRAEVMLEPSHLQVIV